MTPHRVGSDQMWTSTPKRGIPLAAGMSLGSSPLVDCFQALL